MFWKSRHLVEVANKNHCFISLCFNSQANWSHLHHPEIKINSNYIILISHSLFIDRENMKMKRMKENRIRSSNFPNLHHLEHSFVVEQQKNIQIVIRNIFTKKKLFTKIRWRLTEKATKKKSVKKKLSVVCEF